MFKLTSVRLLRTFAPLALPLMVGCAGSTWYVDGSFSPAEAQAIQSAADEWADRTNGQAQVDLVFGAVAGAHSKEILRWHFTPDVENLCNFGLTTYRGKEPNKIMLDPGRSALENVPFHHVAMHEFGHSLGIAVHVDAPTATMFGAAGLKYPVPDGNDCLHRADLEAFCAGSQVDGCDASKMKACDD